jgi:hypothetical protein
VSVGSREYKVIIDRDVLADVSSGLDDLLEDIARAGKTAGLVVKKSFEADDPRREY